MYNRVILLITGATIIFQLTKRAMHQLRHPQLKVIFPPILTSVKIRIRTRIKLIHLRETPKIKDNRTNLVLSPLRQTEAKRNKILILRRLTIDKSLSKPPILMVKLTNESNTKSKDSKRIAIIMTHSMTSINRISQVDWKRIATTEGTPVNFQLLDQSLLSMITSLAEVPRPLETMALSI